MDYYDTIAVNFQLLCDENNITISTVQEFYAGDDDTDMQAINIKEIGTNIICLIMDRYNAEIAFESLQNAGLFGYPYQYIAFSMLDIDNIEYTSQFIDVIQGLLYLDLYFNTSVQQYIDYSEEFWMLHGVEPTSASGPFVYDAVLAVAETISAYDVLSAECVDSDSDYCLVLFNSSRGDALFSLLSNISFKGASGFVSFSSSYERLGAEFYVMNFVNSSVINPVGVVSQDFVDFNNFAQVVFTGGTLSAPSDSSRTLMISGQFIDFSGAPFISVCILTLIEMILCSLVVWFNFRFRLRGYVRKSSPILNIGMVIGCIVTLCAGLIWPYVTPSVCVARQWLMQTGFNLVFGFLFVKAFRIYNLFLKTFQAQRMRDMFTDRYLTKCVVLVTVLDSIALFAVQLLSSSRAFGVSAVLNDSYSDMEDSNITIEDYIYQCSYQGAAFAFFSISIAFKIGILLYGLYMSYYLRTITVKEYDDSAATSVTIASFLFLGTFYLVLSLFVSADRFYYMFVGGILFEIQLILLVNFGKKTFTGFKMRNISEVEGRTSDARVISSAAPQLSLKRNAAKSIEEIEEMRNELNMLRQEIALLRKGNHNQSAQ